MSNRILILGAGFVAGPVVEFLSRNENHQLTVVSNLLHEAEKMKDLNSEISVCEANVTDRTQMSELVQAHDIVISLVPYQFHVMIAELCIEFKRSMITASYVSPEMKQLDQRAKEAGILLLNEIGLDPGIDHLSAMKIIDDAHDEGFEVTQFASWCGGLPAPENNDNPLGYKFAWAPRAVLLALLNEAKYLLNGTVKTVSSNDLLASTQGVEVDASLSLEGYPNRDSTGYKEAYGIPEVNDLIRGTLRYEGFAEILTAAKKLDLLSLETLVPGSATWGSWIQARIESTGTILSHPVKEAFEWLGLTSENLIPSAESMLDAFCHLLKDKLMYQVNEVDMIVLQHKFTLQKAGEKKHLSSTLIVKGDKNGFSAMSKTVGYPVAIASQLILDKVISETGVIIPVKKSVYEPILKQLESENIVCEEKSIPEMNEAFFNVKS